MRISAILTEAWFAALSQRVASVLTIVMVAGMSAAVLLTTGQTAAAEQAALAQIDAVGTRSIIIRTSETAGLTTAFLNRLAVFEGVESVTAFGAITDARNAQVPGAPATGIRFAFGELVAGAQPGTVMASNQAAFHLGLLDGTGGIRTNSGQYLTVSAALPVPEHLGFLEPLAVIVPAASYKHSDHPITVAVVLATHPHLVTPVTRAVISVLGVENPAEVTVETSAQLAALHLAVSGQLAGHGRALVLGILFVAGLLVAANLFGLVQLRRKDYGRRRALGASQALIITLLLCQTLLLAFIGALLGAAVAMLRTWQLGNPFPGIGFTLAVIIASILVPTVAALAPAIAASRRDPLHELRVA